VRATAGQGEPLPRSISDHKELPIG
jgi:hypothetical protein